MKLLIVATFALAPFSVFADDFPTFGQLYSRDDDSALSYDCTRNQVQRLRCEFIRTTISKNAKPEDLERTLAEARDVFPRVAKDWADPKQCGLFRAYLAMLEGDMTIEAALQQYPKLTDDPAEFTASITQYTEDARNNPDLLKGFRALVDMCDSPSADNYLKLKRTAHEKDLRTCRITSRSFTEEFTGVPGLNNDGAWIVSAQPEGLCGVLQLSRFEKDRSDTTRTAWRYIVRRIVSNPTGEVMPGTSCSTLERKEQVFDWKQTRSDYMRCDFVNFSRY